MVNTSFKKGFEKVASRQLNFFDRLLTARGGRYPKKGLVTLRPPTGLIEQPKSLGSYISSLMGTAVDSLSPSKKAFRRAKK